MSRSLTLIPTPTLALTPTSTPNPYPTPTSEGSPKQKKGRLVKNILRRKPAAAAHGEGLGEPQQGDELAATILQAAWRG